MDQKTEINRLVASALAEDLPKGDITTDALRFTHKDGKARLVAKQDLRLSGCDFFTETLKQVDENLKLTWHFSDGDRVLDRQVICTIYGNLVPLLKAERVALNYLMHLSGIASLTARFVEALGNSKTRILDTRKTMPNLRWPQKRAVVHGGGFNHRMSLSDAIMIKDNHISMAGGIKPAVERLRSSLGSQFPIEVEASTAEEALQCVHLAVDRILLDNMSTPLMREILKEIPAQIATEASGNMSLERMPELAPLGLTFISVGALTHSAPSADISLQFC